MADLRARLGQLDGRAALKFTIEFFRKMAVACLRDVPGLMRQRQVDGLIIDQTLVEGPSIADELSLPYVSVCNAMLINPDPSIPPFFTTWPYSQSWWARLRNRVLQQVTRRLVRPILNTVNEHRRRLGLAPYCRFDDAFSPYAQISQQPREFEFPRTLPPQFHFTGPWHDARVRPAASFPFERLDGRPLIYASLGTLQNRQQHLFSQIAAACANLPAQLVLSLGGGAKVESLGKVEGSPILVEFAPQLELLQRAALCITHAGLNTALECLSQGVPMVAIPLANDQPGVAARINWTGTGLFIPPEKLTPIRLRAAIEEVLSTPRYRENAQRLRSAIQARDGLAMAADVIEQVVTTKKPVIASGRPR